MMMKGLSWKQIIILINNDNKIKFIEENSTYITNMNRALKNIKSKVMANFIWFDQSSIIIVTNKVVLPLNLQIIEKYVKNTNHIEANKVKAFCLPQSKSYLKIISIFYLLENTNIPILADIVELIIKSNHIFNNIVVVSRLRIIKMSPKSDMAII